MQKMYHFDERHAHLSSVCVCLYVCFSNESCVQMKARRVPLNPPPPPARYLVSIYLPAPPLSSLSNPPPTPPPPGLLQFLWLALIFSCPIFSLCLTLSPSLPPLPPPPCPFHHKFPTLTQHTKSLDRITGFQTPPLWSIVLALSLSLQTQ
jgi:hypothetical protein